MADKAVVTQTTLDAIGQAIIAKGGATAPMTPAQMPAAIAAIPSGGGGRFGLSVDSFIGYIADGYYKRGEKTSDLVINDEFSVNSDDMKSFIRYNSLIRSVLINNLKNITVDFAFEYAFANSSITRFELHRSSSASVTAGRAYLHICDSCKDLESVVIDGCMTNGVGSTYGLECAFKNCGKLKTISAKGLIRGNHTLYNMCENCVNLEYVYLNDFSFASTYDLNGTFKGCSALKAIHFDNATAIPLMGSTNCLSGTPSEMKIVVPDALYNDWVSATNWNTFSSRIIKVSEYTGE